MKTLKFAALALGASLLATPAMAQDSGVVGTWDTEAVTDFGTFASTMTVSGADGSYTVEMVDEAPEGAPAPAADAPEGTITDVVVEGDTFSFTRNMVTPQGAMTLSYTGTVEGDALTASVDSDFGVIPVTGTRAE